MYIAERYVVQLVDAGSIPTAKRSYALKAKERKVVLEEGN